MPTNLSQARTRFKWNSTRQTHVRVHSTQYSIHRTHRLQSIVEKTFEANDLSAVSGTLSDAAICGKSPVSPPPSPCGKCRTENENEAIPKRRRDSSHLFSVSLLLLPIVRQGLPRLIWTGSIFIFDRRRPKTWTTNEERRRQWERKKWKRSAFR